MLGEQLAAFFERDLRKLKEEINLYIDEKDLWLLKEGINNSAGNLCLHLVGNLNHFIGATLGNTGYIRERDKEFSLKHIARSELNSSIDSTMLIVSSTLKKLSDKDFEKQFPLEKHGEMVSTLHMVLHLFGHFSYHLGQINYHRRLIYNS